MTTNSDLAKSYLKQYEIHKRAELEPFFKEVYREYDQSEFRTDVLEKIEEAAVGGKGLRGALAVLGFNLMGGSETELINRASISMEVFHASLLIHDDIVDKSNLRRGKPSVNSYYENICTQSDIFPDPHHYGSSMGLYAGDIGLFLTTRAIIKSGFPPERIIRAQEILTHYAIRVALGQVLELNIVGDRDVTEDTILNTLWIKSGEYTTTLPVLLGASLSGHHNKELELQLSDYTKYLGWAFQIQDDVLGTFGTEDTGKPSDSDLKEGKNTLLVLQTRNLATPTALSQFEVVLGNTNASEQEIAAARKIIEECGALEKVREAGFEYVRKGESVVEGMEVPAEYKKLLKSLLHFMMERAL